MVIVNIRSQKNSLLLRQQLKGNEVVQTDMNFNSTKSTIWTWLHIHKHTLNRICHINSAIGKMVLCSIKQK